jgi:3-oxoacyl-[acyl-carrier protein] reductase
MDLGLRGKVVIVGGASQGIGYGIARAVAAEGASVVISARREPALGEAGERLRKDTGAEVLTVQADVRKAEDAARVVDATVQRFGAIHALVNNDGAPPIGYLQTFDDVAWTRAVEQNLMSVVRMVRLVVPHMRAVGGGSIVNMTALSAVQPIAGFGLSVATWAGVIGLAKTLSVELGPDRIRVNTITPGYINTTRLEKAFQMEAERQQLRFDQFLSVLLKEVPLGRLGEVDDIAPLVALLLSDRGAFITGTTIAVDGGTRRSVL